MFGDWVYYFAVMLQINVAKLLNKECGYKELMKTEPMLKILEAYFKDHSSYS